MPLFMKPSAADAIACDWRHNPRTIGDHSRPEPADVASCERGPPFIDRSSFGLDIRQMKLLTLPLLALVAGCSTVSAGPVGDGGPIRSDGVAAIDQPTRVGSLVVTPKQVLEDSRCPALAQCVWAGRVVLSARIDGAGWRETVSLTLGEPYLTHGFGLALTSVEPAKLSVPTQPQDYRFGFEAR